MSVQLKSILDQLEESKNKGKNFGILSTYFVSKLAVVIVKEEIL